MLAVLRLVTSRRALRRTLPAAAVVGSVLSVVHHGSALLHERDGGVLVGVALTYLVPWANASYGFVTGAAASKVT